jgi:hypothetical protein
MVLPEVCLEAQEVLVRSLDSPDDEVVALGEEGSERPTDCVGVLGEQERRDTSRRLVDVRPCVAWEPPSDDIGLVGEATHGDPPPNPRGLPLGQRDAVGQVGLWIEKRSLHSIQIGRQTDGRTEADGVLHSRPGDGALIDGATRARRGGGDRGRGHTDDRQDHGSAEDRAADGRAAAEGARHGDPLSLFGPGSNRASIGLVVSHCVAGNPSTVAR